MLAPASHFHPCCGRRASISERFASANAFGRAIRAWERCGSTSYCSTGYGSTGYGSAGYGSKGYSPLDRATGRRIRLGRRVFGRIVP